MDSKRNTTRIKSSVKDILKATNYATIYNYKKNDKEGHLFSTFDKNIYRISYSENHLLLNTNKIRCSPASAWVISQIYLRQICNKLKYPWQYIIYTNNDKDYNDFYLNVEEAYDKKYLKELREIGFNVFDYGLKREFISDALKADCLNDFWEVCGYIFEVEINDIKRVD